MSELTQNTTPEESNIDHERRSLLKALIGGTVGLVVGTTMASPAFAKKRHRNSGQGSNNNKGSGKKPPRHSHPHF
jgi:hypothetical protein